MICGIILVTIFASIGNLTTITGAFNYQQLGTKALCMGDVNGDGFDDLIYTARNFSTTYPVVWILFGGVTPDNIPDVELTYNLPYYGSFGYAIWVEDVNRDGYDDVIASNPVEYGAEGQELIAVPPETRSGREVFIYYGASNISGLRYPDVTIQCPGNVIAYYEFGLDLCTAYFWYDEPTWPDQFPDIVIGCPHVIGYNLPGKIFVYRGPDFTQFYEMTSSRTGDRLGFSVTTADFNHDGLDELVAGGYAENSERGMIEVYDVFGSSIYVLDNPPVETGARFGWDVSAGDVTGDAYADLVISAYRTYPPKVFVSYGNDGWGYSNIPLNQTLTALHSNYDFFGICLSHCGDLNNDLIGDIIIGACQDGYSGVGSGYIAAYFGGNGTINSTPDFVAYGEAYDDGLGYEVNVNAGDINGDGFAEFAVSAPYNDAGGTSAGRVYVYGELALLSSDPLALAYNGNRHLTRKPNTEELYLVYTHNGKVFYSNSTDGGTTWDYTPFEIGIGKFPTITLSSNNLPSVVWTDDMGGIWFRYQTSAGTWGSAVHLYDPWSYWQPRLNSPPSIVITPSSQGDTVHVLTTLHVIANGPQNWVTEYAFPISNPQQGVFVNIEGGTGPQAGAIRYNPAIARCELNNTLHAVWQRADTICYATRQLNQTWNNWGPRFGDEGLFSARPFVETYGDMVYVVWQHVEVPGAPEEVCKGYRQLSWNYFYWTNLSRTPDTWSLYPVNASGWFTVYTDYISPFPDHGAEIFYKVNPDDIAYNISQTADASSFYPQCSARFTSGSAYLYTAWLDGDMPPYRIHFKRLQYIPTDMPYITSLNGYEIPSPYLIARDSFMSEWQIPVDVGNETVTYKFQLDPGYRYRLKAIVYHESAGEWREWIKVDDRLKHQIKYNAYEPETLEFWIPPGYYQHDSMIEIAFCRISGDFAAAGSIEIYRYEYEEGEGEGSNSSGPMAYADNRLENCAISIYPNPFTTKLNIHYGIPVASCRVSIKVYDTAGRLRKNLSEYGYDSQRTVIWNGQDETGRTVAPGVYFLTIENLTTKQTFCHKILRLD